MQKWYSEQRRETEEAFTKADAKANDREIHLSPLGRYSLEVTPYTTGPNCWGYSKGVVQHDQGSGVIAEIKRNFGTFPFSWKENHPNGHDYLIAGEDYQGQTIIELDTGRRIDAVPDSAEQGRGFCWAAHYPSPDGKHLFVDGCYWACPYELILLDFSKPMEPPYQELMRWPVWDVEGFQPDGSFIWSFNTEFRRSDGKRVDQMTEEEVDAFEADENYNELIGDVSVRMRWNPDGTTEVLSETIKE
ncbi:hypothetical protein [Calycomorphotria hydatis]|uniref:WD40-like Beta Propeller Repeat protein n=1 Tax=Calycomorphotria hydatis TaxID=2528027 RepID=A0A517TF69_9PLAN|nr:hypothetical protein [Calycomorphotria hydatis]QDT67019.1 hypothetical protein V22_42910 [Calycomorphotria hydatis]